MGRKSLPQVVRKDRRETRLARSAAGRVSHFQYPQSAIRYLFDPRSSIRGATESGGGTPPARSAAGRDSHFQDQRSAVTAARNLSQDPDF